MRYALSFLSLWTLLGSTAHGNFPPIERLKSQPELPDPLKRWDGGTVTNRDQWAFYRQELQRMVAHYMYGEIPRCETINVKVLFEDANAFDGKATLREVSISGMKGHSFNLMIAIPKGHTKPVPCFVGPNFSGNHTLVKHDKVAITKAWMYPNRSGVKDNLATEAGRGADVAVWNIEDSLARGYAVATFYPGEIDNDRGDVRSGLATMLPKNANTATIACWAWGVHRAIDYLSTVDAIAQKKFIAVGHSRLGKTALLAAAYDDRIAIAIPHQAGCGGSAPSRGKVGESVKQINDRFPHWFNAEFKKFNSDPTKLPFDQHHLVAMCAPRPVLFSNATEDQWANPSGQFDVLKAAEGVYKMFGTDGLNAKTMPAEGVLIKSTLGYYIRPGKHSMTKQDWGAFLDFADVHLKK